MDVFKNLDLVIRTKNEFIKLKLYEYNRNMSLKAFADMTGILSYKTWLKVVNDNEPVSESTYKIMLNLLHVNDPNEIEQFFQLK